MAKEIIIKWERADTTLYKNNGMCYVLLACNNALCESLDVNWMSQIDLFDFVRSMEMIKFFDATYNASNDGDKIVSMHCT